MTTDPGTSNEQSVPITSATVLGARMTWSFFGPAAMILTAFGIVTRGDGWLTALDVVFAIVVGWMLLGRWYDQRRTSTSTTAASGEVFRRYVALLLSIAAGVWVVANVVGNHLLA